MSGAPSCEHTSAKSIDGYCRECVFARERRLILDGNYEALANIHEVVLGLSAIASTLESEPARHRGNSPHQDREAYLSSIFKSVWRAGFKDGLSVARGHLPDHDAN